MDVILFNFGENYIPQHISHNDKYIFVGFDLVTYWYHLRTNAFISKFI